MNIAIKLSSIHFILRLKLFEFWSQNLTCHTLDRSVKLLQILYWPTTEHQFLPYSTNLLLELTSHSPDYTRNIFDLPLSECKFNVCVLMGSGLESLNEQLVGLQDS